MQMTPSFDSSEFLCSCGCGNENISLRLVRKLQEVRDVFGPISITSGVRCADHNRAIGGVDDSAHVPAQIDDEGVVGHAVDIVCIAAGNRFRLIGSAGSRFKRIGMGENFVHLDTDTRKPQNVLFTYYGAKHQA